MALHVTMTNDRKNVARLLDEFEQYAVERSLPEQVRRRVSIALDEVLANLASYSGASLIEVRADISDGRLVIEIEDDGPPFDPAEAGEADTSSALADRSEGGLGVHLVMRMMDEVHYQRRDGKGILTLIQSLAPAPS